MEKRKNRRKTAVSMQKLQKKIHNGKKLLRKLGTATLGVYLFHDNVNFRVMLWDICKNILSAESNSFILLFIICILVIFIIGTIIEIVRGAVMQKIYDILNDIYRRKNA